MLFLIFGADFRVAYSSNWVCGNEKERARGEKHCAKTKYSVFHHYQQNRHVLTVCIHARVCVAYINHWAVMWRKKAWGLIQIPAVI